MITNLAAYQFRDIPQETLAGLCQHLQRETQRLALKGLILLSHEGINLMIAGEGDATQSFKDVLEKDTPFKAMTYKESLSIEKPFTRMVVKVKQAAIPFGNEAVSPQEHTAAYIAPEEFKRWQDEGREMVILDTRNDYEVRCGTFDKAIDFDIQNFSQFPEVAPSHLPDKEQPIVTFCTGGIRCEKAATWLEAQGYSNVYQLEGGILAYFEKCGGAHYQGECFVFDKRVAIDTSLRETDTIQCYACRNPITKVEQDVLENDLCPYCHEPLAQLKTF